MNPTLAATTRIVFCSNSPLQEAAAAGLEQAVERGFFVNQCREYQERRDVLTAAFDKLGLPYSLPQGTYFVLLVCICSGVKQQFMTDVAIYPIGYLKGSLARRLSVPRECQRKGQGLQVRFPSLPRWSLTNRVTVLAGLWQRSLACLPSQSARYVS